MTELLHWSYPPMRRCGWQRGVSQPGASPPFSGDAARLDAMLPLHANNYRIQAAYGGTRAGHIAAVYRWFETAPADVISAQFLWGVSGALALRMIPKL
jgi:hypothetical protein